MKRNYEDAYRIFLPNRTNTIIRLDGKAFSSYTKHFQKPYDDRLISIFDEVGMTLAQEIMGAKLIYLQSDEINIWTTNYDSLQTEPWFNNNLQKIVSVSASIAAAKFNQCRFANWIRGQDNCKLDLVDIPLATFDSRAFIIPELPEVANLFKWRCDDWSRNSVQMLARSLYSHKELEGKNLSELHDLIHAKGQNWNDLENKHKRGRIIRKINNEWIVSSPSDFTFDYWYGLTKDIHNEIQLG